MERVSGFKRVELDKVKSYSRAGGAFTTILHGLSYADGMIFSTSPVLIQPLWPSAARIRTKSPYMLSARTISPGFGEKEAAASAAGARWATGCVPTMTARSSSGQRKATPALTSSVSIPSDMADAAREAAPRRGDETRAEEEQAEEEQRNAREHGEAIETQPMRGAFPRGNNGSGDAGFLARRTEILRDRRIARCEQAGAFVIEDGGTKATRALGGVGFIEKRGRGGSRRRGLCDTGGEEEAGARGAKSSGHFHRLASCWSWLLTRSRHF